MKFSVPFNVIFMILTFSLMDFVNQIQQLVFTTLTSTLTVMYNHTLETHFGIQPSKGSISVMNSFMTSANLAGMLFSLLFLMPLGESKGRKYAVIYVRFTITFIAGLCQLIAALFGAAEFFMVSQFLNGCQVPLKMFVTLLYVMECAPDEHRGFTSTALIFSDVIGQVFMYAVASPNVLGKENTWFIFPLIVLISSTSVFCLNVRLPESPKWLVRQNRMEEAATAIVFYHGKNCSLKEVLESYVREKNLTVENRISMRQVYENDTMREALKIVLAVTMFLTIDSSTVQAVYTVLLHTGAGFTVQQAMNINLVLSILLFPTKFIGTYIIDALGRRPVMAIAGGILYTKSLLMVATQFIIFINGPSLLTEIMYLAVELLTQSVPATGVMSIGILFISELFPPSARLSVAQLLFIIPMMINFPTVSLFPVIYTFFAPGFFLIYIVTQFLLGTYLVKHMPETRARAVCDIIEGLDKDVASRTSSLLEEDTPLLRDRARSHGVKRSSILITSRTRASTFNHGLVSGKWNC